MKNHVDNDVEAWIWSFDEIAAKIVQDTQLKTETNQTYVCQS